MQDPRAGSQTRLLVVQSFIWLPQIFICLGQIVQQVLTTAHVQTTCLVPWPRLADMYAGCGKNRLQFQSELLKGKLKKSSLDGQAVVCSQDRSHDGLRCLLAESAIKLVGTAGKPHHDRIGIAQSRDSGLSPTALLCMTTVQKHHLKQPKAKDNVKSRFNSKAKLNVLVE